LRLEHKKTIRNVEDAPTKVYVSVGISSDDEFVLEGQEIGEGPETHFGDSDYEYWITVDAAHLHRLTELLIGRMRPSEKPRITRNRLLDAVHGLLKGSDTPSSDWMAWLKEHDIPYRFFSY
jgi:hypothetical protein